MYEDNTKIFIDRLRASGDAVACIAVSLLKKGWTVRMGELTETPSYEDRMLHVDKGDLYIRGNGREYRVEIKHNQKWTEEFPWPKVMIMGKAAYDRAIPSIDWIVICNKPLTLYAAIHKKSAKSWTTLEFSDYQGQPTETSYMCCRSVCLWGDVV